MGIRQGAQALSSSTLWLARGKCHPPRSAQRCALLARRRGSVPPGENLGAAPSSQQGWWDQAVTLMTAEHAKLAMTARQVDDEHAVEVQAAKAASPVDPERKREPL
jgi:hypothetical protein